ncbi:MAG: hypothetical protein WKF83_09410 [Nocardioidaceae bacterium]
MTSYVVPSEEGPHRKYYGINDERAQAMLELQRKSWAAFTTTMADLLGTDSTLNHQGSDERASHPDAATHRRFRGSGPYRACSDLSEEEVNELTDGLEADLTEQACEDRWDSEARRPVGVRCRAQVGRRPPAAVRRGEAGVPRRCRRPRQHDRRVMGPGRRRPSASGPAVAAVLAPVIILAPAWWLLRAWVAYQPADHLPGYQRLPPERKRRVADAARPPSSAASSLDADGPTSPRWIRTAVVVGNVLAIAGPFPRLWPSPIRSRTARTSTPPRRGPRTCPTGWCWTASRSRTCSLTTREGRPSRTSSCSPSPASFGCG